MGKLKIYLNYLTWLVAALIPKRKDRWVFGAWFGNRVSDNSYALYRYVAQNLPEVEALWICNDPAAAQRAGVGKALKRNSPRAVWACLTAAVSVMNQGYLDFGEVNWIHRSYRVQLWHGVPWKKIGEDTAGERGGLLHRISHRAYLFANRYDLFIAPSKECGRALQSAFLIDERPILYTGQPRNELLFDEARCREARERILSGLGVGCEKLVVYMPTFRDKSESAFTFLSMAERLSGVLEAHGAVILEKQHYVDAMRGAAGAKSARRIRNAGDIDSQELLAAADVLVTDYSSCFFDFLIRNRPIIHYLYDYARYRDDDRGLYYDRDEVAGGAAVETEEALAQELEACLADETRGADRRARIAERFITFEGPDSCRVVVERIREQTGGRG